MAKWTFSALLLFLLWGCYPLVCHEKECACGGTDCTAPSQYILDEDGGRSPYWHDGGPALSLGDYETGESCDRCSGRTRREGSTSYWVRCKHSTRDDRVMCEHQTCGATCSY